MRGNAIRNTVVSGPSAIDCLLDLSARLGRDVSLVQASTGNTSTKLDGTLWVKASGKWLADADREEVLIPVDLADCLSRLRSGAAPTAKSHNGSSSLLRPSIETYMHAILPHRVVIHVHAVNTVATALRADAPSYLTEKLAGLAWRWLPYVASGLPLACAVNQAYQSSPDTNVFVLGNHGLVVCGADCATAEALLHEVEQRLTVQPRIPPAPKLPVLEQIQRNSRWRLPDVEAVHCLGTDPIARKIVSGGVLTPCQAIFLGQTLPVLPCKQAVLDAESTLDDARFDRPFLIVEGSGVVIGKDITKAEYAILRGFADVVQRLQDACGLRYLTQDEVDNTLQAEGTQYKMAPDNCVKAMCN